MNYLPAIEIESQANSGIAVSASIIWLHGLGASGHDFVELVPELSKRTQAQLGNTNIRYVFPHAAEIAVTINNGMAMPAWYDIFDMPAGINAERKINNQQFLNSVQQVQDLIDREIERGVASDNILVLGFSQGGAVAYHAALSYSHTLAGLAGLSTYFPTLVDFTPSEENKGMEIEIYHGSLDPVVNESLGLKAKNDLTQLGYQVVYHNYAMQHQLCLEQVQDIAQWMSNKLK